MIARRDFIIGAPLSFAATPAGAICSRPVATEEITGKVNRLAWELADALNDYEGGRFMAEVHPSQQHADAPVTNFRLMTAARPPAPDAAGEARQAWAAFVKAMDRLDGARGWKVIAGSWPAAGPRPAVRSVEAKVIETSEWYARSGITYASEGRFPLDI